jgi:DNA (cytosine-5)-methyltransferase 1
LLASKTEDPRPALLAQDAGEPETSASTRTWYGFYWTEGNRGLGWAVDAVPTLKGGSTVGIPSPPAIWNPATRTIVTPDIRDAERLQGFSTDWTLPALDVENVRPAHRWKLVGNAVSVPVARWVGQRLVDPGTFDEPAAVLLPRGVSWPKAAWGHAGKVYASNVSMWPVRWPLPHLAEFLQFPPAPLSERAAVGFLSRALKSRLAFVPGFLKDVDFHVKRMAKAAVA